MKMFIKIKDALKKEFEGYCEERKKRLLKKVFIGFIVLFVLKMTVNVLRVTSPREDSRHETNQEVVRDLQRNDDEPLSAEEMMYSLQQIRQEIQQQKRIYEKHVQ